MRMIAGTRWLVEDARRYIEARIRVDERGCWIWQRACPGKGYGRADVPLPKRIAGGHMRIAHRLAYETSVGAIPHGLCVLHKCDVPACVNPDHLFLGTRADNQADMTAKGRSLRGDRHNMAKLTEADVRNALRRLAAGETRRSIADSLGVRHQTISKIARGLIWGDVSRDVASLDSDLIVEEAS